MKYINLQTEFKDALNAATFSYPVHASTEFDQTNTMFPRVTVRQIDNTPRHYVSSNDDTPTDSIATRRLAYQFDVLTRDTLTDDDVAHDREDVMNILCGEIADWLWSNYGMDTNVYNPTVYDDATLRGVVRANGTIDSYGYIYNR